MKPTRQQFAETLGKCLDIIEESRRDSTAKSAPSIHDFRKPVMSTRTDEHQRRREIARERRALRIRCNGYLSSGQNIPPQMQERIDSLEAEALRLDSRSAN